ncbi:MAG: phenylalanine--tRNA ligase subunit beta [Dehalococcoidia bacterium]|nr:phenylalanine--tRNA ligase subunit beta [Dehalococcoidia bacterium]
MKAPIKWLNQYVDIKLAPQVIANKLTMAGIETQNIDPSSGKWADIFIGEVTDIQLHPHADRLKLATINLGDEQVSVVCGAPNISTGQKVPFAKAGAQLVDAHTGKLVMLKPAKIRGVASNGMVCSEKELGISDQHEGIMILPPDAPIGTPLSTYLGNTILDLDVTPNRSDCLSMIGIAREIAALTGEKLHLPEVHYKETDPDINSFISIDIEDPTLCPRYCASLVTDITIGPSPDWLQQRLASYGMKPINNIVDISNYVMLEYGQPLHTFDYHKISGKQIIIRRAKDKEALTTLDGAEHTLTPNILVIADSEGPIAIGGIMGGLRTEITEKSTSILLESANFNRAIIRQGCTQLNLQSEASTRFDKGLSPGLPLIALQRAIQLLVNLAGGKAHKGIIDIQPEKVMPNCLSISPQELKRIGGFEVAPKEMLKALRSLGFECQKNTANSRILITTPYWRSDINCVADIIEEILRIIGYDKIPRASLSSSLPRRETSEMLNLKQKLRSIMTSCGCHEILTYSLISREKIEKLSPSLEQDVAPMKIANPMSREQEYLRTSLQPGLLSTMAYNQKNYESGIRIFEIGKIFLPHADATAPDSKSLPEEKEMLCFGLSGPRQELSWHNNSGMLDFFDAKGIVENLLSQLKLHASFEPCKDKNLFPGRSASIIVNGDKIGIIGDLHPRVTQEFDLSSSACLAEIDIDKLLDKKTSAAAYNSIFRFPSITRDLALVIDKDIDYQRADKIIRGFPLVTTVTLFDIYEGKQIPQGKKSLALRIVYQSADRTLTDAEANQIEQQILHQLDQELGAKLRS